MLPHYLGSSLGQIQLALELVLGFRTPITTVVISKKTISHQYHQLSIARAERNKLTAALRGVSC